MPWLIYKTVVLLTLFSGYETWAMPAKNESEQQKLGRVIGASVLEHRRNEQILEEAKMEPIHPIHTAAI